MRPAIEQLEDLIRRYEARKSSAGVREQLSDDIKSASLEMLVPTDLEKHFILNKNRLTSYDLMKQEIEMVIESSVGSKGSIARPGTAHSSSGPQPMDVDSITQWIASLVKGHAKGKGKSKGNDKGKGKGKDGKGSSKGSNKGSSKGSSPNKDKDIECYNCGKKGRRSADCWSKKKEKGKGKPNQKGSQKGKKHVSGLEDGEEEYE